MPLNARVLNTATFAELLADTHHTAVHLEMRDVYVVGDEAGDFDSFLRTGVANLLVVEPADPFRGGEFDVGEAVPGPAGLDQLCHVEARSGIP